MNPNIPKMPTDDARFDRLVDGELSEAERRDLLARLDDEPGGWRRCALAFLEAQCWKQTAKALIAASPPAAAASVAAPSPPILRRGTPRGRWTAATALAASLLLAFWLGTAIHSTRVEPPAMSPGASSLAVQHAPPNRQLVGAPAQGLGEPWRIVNVSAPSEARDARLSFNVPAVERDSFDPQWLQNMPSAMPEDVMRAFVRTGHQVQQRRDFVPVPLKDGRRLVMPVDTVEVKYNPEETY